MKSTSSLWYAPNAGATNSSGFSAMPYGHTTDAVNFAGPGNDAKFWTNAEKDNSKGKILMLFN